MALAQDLARLQLRRNRANRPGVSLDTLAKDIDRLGDGIDDFLVELKSALLRDAIQLDTDWQPVSRTMLDAAATSIKIGGPFNGRDEGEYRLDFNFILATGSAQSFRLRLNDNGVIAAIRGARVVDGTGSTGSIWAIADTGANDDRLWGSLRVKGTLDAMGNTVFGLGGFADASTAAGAWHMAGHWDNDSENITSMEIDSTVTNGIEAGSVVRVYRRPVI